MRRTGRRLGRPNDRRLWHRGKASVAVNPTGKRRAGRYRLNREPGRNAAGAGGVGRDTDAQPRRTAVPPSVRLACYRRALGVPRPSAGSTRSALGHLGGGRCRAGGSSRAGCRRVRLVPLVCCSVGRAGGRRLQVLLGWLPVRRARRGREVACGALDRHWRVAFTARGNVERELATVVRWTSPPR